ncbi:MAG: cytochrome c oxidase subunit I [Alphaproteobacteria bacterium HGW-Alphaproteobacteria-18]|nr:MAG: cytochrome c oxidase subunit I [Alphaproteobacteria bacterium HGW-Alphaproteobacteria-18]
MTVTPQGSDTDQNASSQTAANLPQPALRLHWELDRVWRNDRGLRGQLRAVNHSTVGLRFMCTSLIFFGIGGILAMLIRTQLATREGAFLDTELYNQIFTMHGTIMMFLFAIPMLEGLAMYLLPKMLGTRDMAFPRLSSFGYWCFLFGGLILLVAMFAGVAPRDGWFMYTPLSSSAYSPGINADVWLLGVTFVEISALAAAVEITVTILRMRAPGMKLTDMPLFVWYILGAAAMMLAGFPPLIAGSVLLEMERAFDWPFFDPERGGDPLLWQHLFWLFGHPEVYIIFLPAAGVISTIIPVLSRTRILGYGAIVASILGLVFLSFGLWVHHMFTVGIPHMALAFFSAASLLVAVPTAVQVFAWIGTMWKGRPQLQLPMLYILGFFFTFVMGGLTGVMLAIVPFNWQVHDTAFVTAHLHYVLIGGFVFPMMAGLTYWLPMITGRQRIKGIGELAFWTILIGFHGTFFIMHLTGLIGMPRRIDVYPDNPEWGLLNLVSSVFGFIMTIGFALFALGAILQAWLGKRTARDPWKAPTLDWAMALPPPSYNFASLPGPAITGMEDAGKAALPLARGEGMLPGAPRGRREVLVTSVGEARMEHVAILPSNTAVPLFLAAAVGVFVLLMLFGLYHAALVSLMPVLWLVWRWARNMVSQSAIPPVHVAPGVLLPVHYDCPNTLTSTGLRCFLFANGTFFASLVFGLAFLSLVSPGPPPPEPAGTFAARAVIIMFGLLALVLASVVPGRLLQKVPSRAVTGRLVLFSLAANLITLLAAGGLALWQMEDPTVHARGAVQAALLGYVCLHVFISGVFSAFVLDQNRRGEVSADRLGALRHWKLWQAFTMAIAVLSSAVIFAQGVSI